MKFKKFAAMILSLLMISGAMMLAACEGDGGSTVDEKGRTKVSFWYWGSTAEVRVYEELIDTYMDLNEDVIIVPTHYESNTYMTKFQSETTKPDVFFMPDTDFAQWVDAGIMLPLDSYVTESEINSLWETGINEYYYNMDTKKLGRSSGAQLYGFPKDLGPVTLAYNKKVLDRQIAANGLNSAEVYAKLDKLSPMTWTEFADLCNDLMADQKAKDKNNRLYAIPYCEMDAMIYSGGGDYFDKNDPTKPGIDEAFIQTITYIIQLATVHGVMPDSDHSGQNAYTLFENDKIIFTWIGPWDNADFWANPDLKYDIIPVPYNSNIEGAHSKSMIGSMCYGVSENSKVKEQAVKFAKWLSVSNECQNKAMYLGQQVPNIKSLADAYISDSGNWVCKSSASDPVLPASRSLFVDIMDGSADTFGYWAAAGKTDCIEGKTRALYYTYGSTWKDNFNSYLATRHVWDMASADDIRAALVEYRTTYQHDLDEMYGDWRG